MLNGMLTWAAIVLALCFGAVSIAQVEWTMDVTPWSVAVHLDPVFLVWDQKNSIPGSACALGPVIIMEERWRGTEREAYLMHHEMNHVRQWYSLGWTMWPAYWFDVLAIEAEFPEGYQRDWGQPAENDRYMWTPGEWPRWAHFLTIEIRLGS